MENHYHLMIETVQANLSRFMHSVNTAYTLYFNKKHGRCGHLFQGRFKAILIQADIYAHELAPYIHLNPVRALIVDAPEKYPWSNYRHYAGMVETPPWMKTSFVLGLFASTPSLARRRYIDYVNSKIGVDFPNPLKAAQETGILGSESFLDQMRKLFPGAGLQAGDRELPRLRRLRPRPDISRIFESARRTLGPNNRLARDVAIFISHHRADYLLKELGAFFGLGLSGITDACRRVRRSLEGNATLAQAIQEIERGLGLIDAVETGSNLRVTQKTGNA